MAQAEVLPLRQRRLGLPLASLSGGAFGDLLLICAQLPHGQLDPALLAAFEACAREHWRVRRSSVRLPACATLPACLCRPACLLRAL